MSSTIQRSAPDAVTMLRPAVRRRTVTCLPWAVPAVATAALGLYEIDVPMLWRDELATWSAASRTLPQLWTMLHHTDGVLGVYYFGLHLWMMIFGDSATAMRLPSVIAMTGAAAVVGLTGRRLAGVGAGLAGGLIFALIPSVSRYAQEARPYAFAEFFAALATLLLLRAVERPTWRRWSGYALALAAVGACNLVAICVLAAHAVLVFAVCRRRTERAGRGGVVESVRLALADGQTRAFLAGWSWSAIAAVVLDSPVILVGFGESKWQIGPQPRPSFVQLTGLHGGLWPQLFCSSHAVAIAVLVLAVGSVCAAPRRATSWCGLTLAIVPIVAVWVISQGPSSYWVVRYLLFTVPNWALAAGLGVAAIAHRVAGLRLARPVAAAGRRYAVPRPRYVVAAGLVVAVGVLGIHDQRALRQPESHNLWAYPSVVPTGGPVDYQGAVAVIAARQRPGDGIVFQVSDENHDQVDTAVAYYLRGQPMPRPVFQVETQAQAGELRPVECADPASCLDGTPRLWVVYVNRLPQGGYSDPFAAIPADEAAVLREAGYRTQTLFEEDGMTVALLVAR